MQNEPMVIDALACIQPDFQLSANARRKLLALIVLWRSPEVPPLNEDGLKQGVRNGARMDCAQELEAVLQPNN